MIDEIRKKPDPANEGQFRWPDFEKYAFAFLLGLLVPIGLGVSLVMIIMLILIMLRSIDAFTWGIEEARSTPTA